GSEPGSDRHSEDGYEEQKPEEETPPHTPDRPRTDGVVVRRDFVLPILVPDDCGDRVRLDDQVRREPLSLLLGLQSGRLVRIADRNEVCHLDLLSSRRRLNLKWRSPAGSAALPWTRCEADDFWGVVRSR